MTQRLFIETHGCQMNELDSELVVAAMRRLGFETVEEPESADLILFNTCSIREPVENKIFSALGKLRGMKQNHPEKIIGVLGCMAQRHRGHIFERAPYIDFVVGPGQLHQIEQLVAAAARGDKHRLEISLDREEADRDRVARSHESFDPLREPRMRPNRFQAYLRVQIGCDRFCAYCVVPSVRGPERYRPLEEIVAEARMLVDQGCLEITLLGQSINRYHGTAGERTHRLPDVLEAVAAVRGLARLKFVTSHPAAMTDEILRAVRDIPVVSPYLHVPAQSGSTEVLRRMRRGYTTEEYRDLLDRIGETIPGAAVSSDFIVGFCGETEEDYRQTVDLVRYGRFKNCFIFKYDPRSGTFAADHYADDVPIEVKRRRNSELVDLQNEISRELNEAMIGRTVEVLVEGPSKLQRRKAPGDGSVQMTGRTVCDRIVVFDGRADEAGTFRRIVVTDCTPHTLIGAAAEPVPCGPALASIDLAPPDGHRSLPFNKIES